MALDHVLFYVPESKLEPLVKFLTLALEHTGFKEHFRPVPNVVGLGEEKAYFWLTGTSMDREQEAAVEKLTKPHHIAFAAESKFTSGLVVVKITCLILFCHTDIKQVKQFYMNALKAGGIDNGAPGPRPFYFPSYYGAFVKDPACSINFEMVWKGCPVDENVVKKLEADADTELNA